MGIRCRLWNKGGLRKPYPVSTPLPVCSTKVSIDYASENRQHTEKEYFPGIWGSFFVGQETWYRKSNVGGYKKSQARDEQVGIPSNISHLKRVGQRGRPSNHFDRPSFKIKIFIKLHEFWNWEWFNHEIVLIHPQYVGLLPPQLKARSQITFCPEHIYFISNSAQNIFA